MAQTPVRRFLVVPDLSSDVAEVVSCVATSGDEPNEAGLRVSLPTRSTTATPGGDIALSMGGAPETALDYTVALTREGVVEDARWAWVDASADSAADLQFRQSPHVIGRRPDVVEGVIFTSPLPGSRAVRPRLLTLASGDVLMVWTRRNWMPIWARDATTLGTTTESIYWSRLDHTTDTWSTPASGPVPFSVTGGAAFISAVDVTQFPDTGEIVMCVATSESMTPPTPPNDIGRIMFVYVSQDDGDSWTLKHRLHMDGPIPDVTLDTDGDGDLDDLTPVQDWALERLDSGRLCLFTVTENYTWSLTSDDRGASWLAVLVGTHTTDQQYAGHGSAITICRNGMAMCLTALRGSSNGLSNISTRFTRDGVSFSAAIFTPQTTPIYETCDVSACVSPDGWPHIYGTEHGSQRSILSARLPQDWLWGRRLKTRDPDLADVQTSVFPSNGGGSVLGPAPAFHCGTGSPYGSYAVPGGTEDINPCGYDGFVGLDVVQYRGQVLMAVVHQRDDATQPESNEQPDLASYGLMVYRLNSWQPIQERVANAFQDVSGTDTYEPAWPAIGRVYNNTWDCYDTPNAEGWSKTGGVTPTFAYAGTDGGYMEVSGAPCYWEHVTSGDVIIGLGANVRFVVNVQSGGSITQDDIAVRLSLNDLVGHSDVSIRLKRNGANLEVQLYDNVNAAALGTAKSVVHHDWVEILYAQHRGAGTSTTLTTYCAVRSYARSTDPDWDAPYEWVVNGTTLAVGVPTLAEWIRFGHFTSGTQKSRWKGVHLSRCWTRSGDIQSDEACALVRAGVTYIDDDAVNDRSTTGTGESPLDDGIDNWMRTCRTLAVPPIWTKRGTSLSFRGEAVTRGQWACRTGYDFAASNILIQPVLREWRGETDDTETAIVIDAGTVGWRPDSVAVFGHNLAGFTFQFAQANTSAAWSSPAVSFQFCMPTLGVTPNRYIHIWSTTSGIDGAGHRVTYTTSAPWRPHQFKSDQGGPTFYFGKLFNNRLHVWKIADNSGNTLFLSTNTDDASVSVKGSGVIFSDRFAVMVGHHFDEVDPDVLVTYRYCRIVMRKTRHLDLDAAFPRVGRIVLGQTLEITTQDAEWGWRTGYASGSVLTQQPTGAAYSRRLRPTQRTWEADWPAMLPPPEASAVSSSPNSQPTDHSWAWWWDTVRRLDGDGTAAALAWDDGERFVGFDGEEVVQVCSDPLGLAMCHVTATGTLEHIAYTGVTENLAAGATCVPRPVAAVRGITFTETF